MENVTSLFAVNIIALIVLFSIETFTILNYMEAKKYIKKNKREKDKNMKVKLNQMKILIMAFMLILMADTVVISYLFGKFYL